MRTLCDVHGHRSNLCRQSQTVGLHRNGALAEFVALPASACVRVKSYGLSADVAALTQPMAIAVHVVNRSRATAGETSIVIGAGGIGSFTTFVLAQRGVDVTAVDISAERLDIALRLGAKQGLHPAESRPTAPLVFKVTGRQGGIHAANSSVTVGGRVVFVGLPEAPVTLDVRSVTLREIEMIGSNAHVAEDDVATALEMLARDREVWKLVAPFALPLDALIDDGLMPLSAVPHARSRHLSIWWTSAPRSACRSRSFAAK